MTPSPAPLGSLVPLPGSITPAQGFCELPPRSRWSGEAGVLELLAGWLSKLRASPASGATLALRLDCGRRDLGEEGYELRIEPETISAVATSAAGLVYASQTLRQLAFHGNGRIPCARIADAPRFAWRGLMLDSARHFFPLDTVLRLLELASLHKLNRFHWHLTDDQGWRLEIRSRPRLTEVGSVRRRSQVRGPPLGEKRRPARLFDSTVHQGFYTQREAGRVVEHAARLGITVVPEIDMPGHMQAAIAAYPELGNGRAVEVATAWGISPHILNVEPGTVAFLEGVLEETLAVFPGPWIHLGGDEVPREEWEKSPSAKARVRQLGLAGVAGLQGWLATHFAGWLSDRARVLVGWDEILKATGGRLPEGTVLMSWRGERAGLAAARAGGQVIMTPASHTYFDHPQTRGRLTLPKVYEYDPVPSKLQPTEARHVLGSQGQLWTEWIADQDTLDRQAFPRLCALSEVLWTPAAARTWPGFQARLPGHRQLLDALGVRSHP